ncbi:hypothetical protein Hanom_Chr05g00452011 [Helianthus anomalus]
MGFEPSQVSARDGLQHETSFGSERVQFELSFGPRWVSARRRFRIGTRVGSDHVSSRHETQFFGFVSDWIGSVLIFSVCCFVLVGFVSVLFRLYCFVLVRFRFFQIFLYHFGWFRFDFSLFASFWLVFSVFVPTRSKGINDEIMFLEMTKKPTRFDPKPISN